MAVLLLLIVAGLVTLGRFAPSTGEPPEPERPGSARVGQAFSPSVHALAAGSSLVCVPTSAHSPGANGAVWRTDLEIHNPGSVQASYTIALLKRDTDNTNATKVSSALGPGLSQRYGDAVYSLFAFTGGAALQVTVTSGTLLVTSDTYNLQSNGSTYGQFVPAMSSSDAITSGDQGRLIQLTHDPGGKTSFRTNIGLVNATTTPVAVTVDLFSSHGSQLGGTQSVTLKGLEFQQWDKIFERVTSQVVSDGYAIVRTTTAGGSFFAYASLVDNRTGDPICLPAVKVAAGSNPATPTPTGPTPTPTSTPIGPAPTPTRNPSPTPTPTQPSPGAADLRLYTPSTWPACIVCHYRNDWDTSVTPFLSAYYNTYVYFNIANFGSAPFSGPIEMALYIDGGLKGVWSWDNPDGLNGSTYITLILTYSNLDIPAGLHAVRIVLDPNHKINLASRASGDCSANWTWTSILLAPRSETSAQGVSAAGRPAAAVEAGRARVEEMGASAQLVAPSASYIVPTSAHSPGANGAVWRTDLEVHNPGSVQVYFSIALLRRDTDNTNAPGISFTMAPGLSQRYEDVVYSLFAFTGGAALQVTVTSGTLLVTSDTYNLQSNGSTYGQFVPAMSSSDAITSGDQGRLIQLTHDPGGKTSFRTNIGLVNATTTPVAVTVDLFSFQGLQLGGTQSVTLKGLEFQQWDKVFEKVTNQVVSDGYAIVRTATAGGSFFAYASLVDNRTGDPIFIPAQKPGSASAAFVYGTSRTYTAPTAAGGQIQDDVTGFVFQFPQGGSGTLKVTKTVSGPGIEANHVAFKAEYTGQQQVNLAVNAGTAVYARLLGYMDGRFVDTLGEFPQGRMGWFGIPDLETVGSVKTFPLLLPGAARPAARSLALSADPPAVSDYSVDLNSPPKNTVPADILAAYNQFGVKRDALVAKFLGLFSGAERTTMNGLLTGLHTSPTLIVARDVDPSYYKPYVIHPWLKLVTHEIYLGLNSQSFNHEFGHYLHHLLIGDPFLTLPTRGTVFHGHALGKAGAAGVPNEEPAYFTEFFAAYNGNENVGEVGARIHGDWLTGLTANPETADYPDLEGFTSHMLAQVVRRTSSIHPFRPINGTDPIPVPVVQAGGGTNELFHDCYNIISGITTGTTVYGVRDAIEADLEAKGGQGWKLPPILQAIGWNYRVQFQFVDVNGNLLPGFSAYAVTIGPAGERFELPDGHSSLAPTRKTSTGDADDPYTLDWCYGGRNTVLHINELNRDYPVKIEIPWDRPTNQIVTIPDVIIGPGSLLQLIVYEKPRGRCPAWDDGFSADIVPIWNGATFQYSNTSSHTNPGYGDTFSSDITLTGAVSADRRTLTSLQVGYHFKDAWPTSASCHNGSCDTEEWFTVTLANVPAATDWATAFYHFRAEGAAALAAITGFSNRQIITGDDCTLDVDPSIPEYTHLDIWLAAPPK